MAFTMYALYPNGSENIRSNGLFISDVRTNLPADKWSVKESLISIVHMHIHQHIPEKKVTARC